MKEELENKKRMEDIQNEIDKKQEEIEDEFTPGAYFYDIEKVEALQAEIREMKKEYSKLEQRPTKEKTELAINNIEKQLEILSEEKKEFDGVYYVTDDLQEILDEEKKLNDQLIYNKETLEIIDEITKIEKEIDDLNEEYAGANFIPDEVLNEKEEKENKLEELKKKLDGRNINIDNIEKIHTGPDQGPEPGPDQGPEPGPDQGPDQGPEPGPDQGPDQGPEPGPDQGPEPRLDKNIEIIIGRKASINIDDKEYKINKKIVKEGINIGKDEILEILENNGFNLDEDNNKEIMENLIDNGFIDSTIIHVINKSDMEDKTKGDALEAYVNDVYLASEKDPYDKEINIIYDEESLSKSNFFSRLFRREINGLEKNQLIAKARLANRYGIAERIGEYKPDLLSRFTSIFSKNSVQAFPTMEDQYTAAQAYNEAKSDGKAVDVELNEFKEKIKYLPEVQQKEALDIGIKQMEQEIEQDRDDEEER